MKKGLLLSEILLSGMLLVGCGSTSNNSTSSSTSSEKTEKKANSKAQLDVIDLFKNPEDKKIKKDLTHKRIAKVKSEVTKLNSSKQKNEMLKDLKNADGQVTTAKEFSEDNAKTKASSLSASKAESKSQSIKKANSRSNAPKKSSSFSTAVTKASSKKSKYTPVEKKFSLNSIESESDNTLFMKGIDVVLKDYYIVDMGADKMHQYHLLLAPDESSNVYFLAVFDSKVSGKVVTGESVSVYGSLNGKSKVTSTQVNTGISSSYLDKKIILISVDKVVQ